jgi:hypothetical protein
MVNPTKVIDDSFFEERTSVNKETGCIEWTRHTNVNGYGTLKYKRKQRMAHRFMWEYKYGAIPEGKIICHKCDNRKCINPEHLFLGTTQDNVDDKMKKGRFVASSGEKNGYSKLTKEQIIAIRDDVRPQTKIALDYGISQSNVSIIKRKQSWSHIDYGFSENKKLNVKQFAELLGLPYLPLKERIYGGYLTITESVNRTAKQFNKDFQIEPRIL